MILMYHNLLPDKSPYGYRNQSITLFNSAFIKQIKLLQKFFEIIPITEYVDYYIENKRTKKNCIVITFDDGTFQTYECMKKNYYSLDISSTIFISTCQVDNGPLIWGAYLNALCYENIYHYIEIGNQAFELLSLEQKIKTRKRIIYLAKLSGDPIRFVKNINKAYPIPNKIRRYYKGVSSKQIEEASKYNIEIGSHSINHPYLSEIPSDEQHKEILKSKLFLEERIRGKINYFAYPSGDYNNETINMIKNSKYKAAFSTTPKFITADKQFEFPRIGIYNPSKLRFLVKILKEVFKF